MDVILKTCFLQCSAESLATNNQNVILTTLFLMEILYKYIEKKYVDCLQLLLSADFI
jgi:hypothetical protein